MLRKLMAGRPKEEAYAEVREELGTAPPFLDAGALEKFDRILRQDIRHVPEAGIRSSGLVVDTLEAALWCFLTTDDYKEAVLRAVNLGEDTDTTAAVAGALAAVAYGPASIPGEWLAQLQGREQIFRAAERMARALATAGKERQGSRAS